MKYRKINSNFWEDGYILGLSNEEKLLFLYLFTNSKVNMVGIYELPDVIICSSLGASIEQLSIMKEKLQKDNKYAFYKGWVFVNNFSEHNHFSTVTNVLETYLKDFNAIPQEILNYFFHTLKLDYIPTIKNKKGNEVIVIDMDIVIVKDTRGYTRTEPYKRIGARTIEERVNPDDVPI
ncbi:MAG: Phage replication protein [Candidatus Woesebacteria bacterium GW2011_GWB1_39_12]|uniref:Phage replication protein n=1 Tax=Candidatus Woesebacteria bacterium GW2011_GWB1_39_12 TaxID=1618574 RepID=A0A0G0QEL8_9BACT|nr:MAG: Phage replication protein [Candidatus Woesebacteria bacterium GW2011_GWB1_39_12]